MPLNTLCGFYFPNLWVLLETGSGSKKSWAWARLAEKKGS